MIITTRHKRLHIDESIFIPILKFLGINTDANLTWSDIFHFVCKKVSMSVWLLSMICSYLSYEHKVMFYNAYIQPHFNYCKVIFQTISSGKSTAFFQVNWYRFVDHKNT